MRIQFISSLYVIVYRITYFEGIDNKIYNNITPNIIKIRSFDYKDDLVT